MHCALWFLLGSLATGYAHTKHARGCGSQSSVLMDIYHATSGDKWTMQNNWGRTDVPVCQWTGVYCNDNSDIIGLNLNWFGLVGTLPQSISCLKTLEYLFASGNNLQGESNLKNMCGLANLKYLQIRSSSIKEALPKCFCSLYKMELLDLEGNMLSDIIPNCITHQKSLATLNLKCNNLKGSINLMESDTTGTLRDVYINCNTEFQCPDVSTYKGPNGLVITWCGDIDCTGCTHSGPEPTCPPTINDNDSCGDYVQVDTAPYGN